MVLFSNQHRVTEVPIKLLFLIVKAFKLDPDNAAISN